MLGDAQTQGSSWASWGDVSGGLSGQIMLATPNGFRAAADFRLGDTLRSSAGGPVTVVAQRMAAASGVWMRIPPLALGNRREIVVAAGQGLLIESAYAARMLGSTAVVLPALALGHWRGIAPCKTPPMAVSLTLSRPALVLGAAGEMVALDGPANDGFATENLPPVPSLSLASARQMIACLIAYDAGASLRGLRHQAAAF